MNYRHIYHAGNICDIVKHTMLVSCLDYLRLKDKGFCVLDTHAGIGLYDLKDERALKTNEAAEGIYKLLDSPPLTQLSSFYDSLKKINTNWNPDDLTTTKNFQFYPGSPNLIYLKLRPQDRMIACELHPEDCEDLRYLLGYHKQVQVHHRDGYEALRAFLPPPEKRGLVLIDPPYERSDEFEELSTHIQQAHQRWPSGMFLVWYPIKERPAIWRFHEKLATTGIAQILCAEFIYMEESRTDRLNGSGCIIINPPWTFEKELPLLFQDLHQCLDSPYRGTSVKWLTP